ncbi:MAG: tRNA (cytidine(56)-2'-O)-methyltransferase [Desulfurococcaceae archaeon]
MRILVLRIGHRPGRDKRITTHVGLVARAFGGSGFVLGDVVDDSVVKSLSRVVELWGGQFLLVQGVDSAKFVEAWKASGGVVVHLTMYGVHIDDVLHELRRRGDDMLVVVGAEKVPGWVYDAADYNVAIGNQPHSEVSALAIFLDRIFGGEELHMPFPGAKIYIVPSPKGKVVRRVKSGRHGQRGSGTAGA